MKSKLQHTCATRNIAVVCGCSSRTDYSYYLKFLSKLNSTQAMGKKQEPKESICGLTSLPGPGTAKLNTPRSLNRKMLVPLIFTGI